jgi:hypothetical protein
VAVNVALLCVFQRSPIDFLDILVTGGAHMEPLRIYDPRPGSTKKKRTSAFSGMLRLLL